AEAHRLLPDPRQLGDGEVDRYGPLGMLPVVGRLRVHSEGPRILRRVAHERLQERVADVLRTAAADRPQVIDERSVSPPGLLLQNHRSRAARPCVGADEVRARRDEERRSDTPDDAAGPRRPRSEEELSGNVADAVLAAVAEKRNALIDDRNDD